MPGILGNPYKVVDHGRDEAIRLHCVNTLPMISDDLIGKVKAASFVGCFCEAHQRCHTDNLLDAAFPK